MDLLGGKISLAEDSVVYIKRNGKLLDPNTDDVLWFSKSNPTGEYIFEVETIDGKIYIAILDWIKN